MNTNVVNTNLDYRSWKPLDSTVLPENLLVPIVPTVLPTTTLKTTTVRPAPLYTSYTRPWAYNPYLQVNNPYAVNQLP